MRVGLSLRAWFADRLFDLGDLVAIPAQMTVVDDRPSVIVACEACGTDLPIPYDIKIESSSDGDLSMELLPEFDALRLHHWSHQEGVFEPVEDK